MHSERFKVNPAKVVHETIEGEAIIIHLESGFYYSVDGVGAEMWGLLAAGCSADEVAGELEHRYAADGPTIAGETRRLASELALEDLLEPTAEPEKRPSDGSLEHVNGTRLEFAPPVLKKYEDMQDFLLVDPIHQTTDAGWPEARPEA